MTQPEVETPEELALLPGMAITALWMLIVCAIGLFGVIAHHFPGVVTIFCALLAAGAQGLLKRRRWGWAIALSTAFLSVCYGVWAGIRFHQPPALVLVMVNLVLFLYLVRPEVISRVR
jgi:ABC-type Mn2+/Zn2+ transport system permease subunit